jgi:LysM repeat protein
MKTIVLNKIAELKNKFVSNKENAEEKINSLSLKSTIFVVAGLHVAAIFGLMFFSSASKAKAIAIEDKRFLENAPMVGVEDVKAKPSPTATPKPKVATPTPTPKVAAKPTPTPVPKELLQTKVQDPKEHNPEYPVAKEHVVKQGETLYKIAHIHKMKVDKLQEINGIKDPTKLSIGQKLKLM